MNLPSGQSRMLESRVVFLEQSLKEITKKNIQIEHKTVAIQNKQIYIQDLIHNLSLQLKQVQISNSYQNKNSLSDMTPYHNLPINLSHNKQNSSKSLKQTENSQILQLLQTLQSHTISNLEQLDSKISHSHQQLESKSSKMELRMVAIWKQAQTLIQNLTFQIQTNQLKTRTLEDRSNRDRQIITNTINSLEERISSIFKSQKSQFSQDIFTLRSSLQTNLNTLSNKIQSIDFSQILESTKTQIHAAIKKNNEKIMEKIISQIQENLKNSSTFDSSIKNKNSNLNKKIQRFQKDIQENKIKLKDLQKQIKHKISTRQNWRNKFKQNTQENIQKRQSNQASKQSEKFISLQNSQGPQENWSYNSNSIETSSKIPDLNKKCLPKNQFMPNNPLQTLNPLDKAFSAKKMKQINDKQQQISNQAQEVYGRGIAGLRSMKKKEEEIKSSFSREKKTYEEPKSSYTNDLRNPASQKSNLRQLPGSQSPPRMQSNNALPPLSSEKSLTKKSQMPRQQQMRQIAKYQNYGSTPENESQGEESYYVDEEGFLIDKEGNRVVNEDGQEIKLSYDDIQRLREMEN